MRKRFLLFACAILLGGVGALAAGQPGFGERRYTVSGMVEYSYNETFVVEPFNLLYRVEVFCRPQNNPWNLSFMISNVDDYQMERSYQPLFSAGAWYDFNEHWRLNLWAQCKPTGMFHLDATFYGATFRTGFSYRF